MIIYYWFNHFSWVIYLYLFKYYLLKRVLKLDSMFIFMFKKKNCCWSFLYNLFDVEDDHYSKIEKQWKRERLLLKLITFEPQCTYDYWISCIFWGTLNSSFADLCRLFKVKWSLCHNLFLCNLFDLKKRLMRFFLTVGNDLSFHYFLMRIEKKIEYDLKII